MVCRRHGDAHAIGTNLVIAAFDIAIAAIRNVVANVDGSTATRLYARFTRLCRHWGRRRRRRHVAELPDFAEDGRRRAAFCRRSHFAALRVGLAFAAFASFASFANGERFTTIVGSAVGIVERTNDARIRIGAEGFAIIAITLLDRFAYALATFLPFATNFVILTCRIGTAIRFVSIGIDALPFARHHAICTN